MNYVRIRNAQCKFLMFCLEQRVSELVAKDNKAVCKIDGRHNDYWYSR